jgi:Zn finger protein HypA/HybF involved in hydrogenase expression
MSCQINTKDDLGLMLINGTYYNCVNEKLKVNVDKDVTTKKVGLIIKEKIKNKKTKIVLIVVLLIGFMIIIYSIWWLGTKTINQEDTINDRQPCVVGNWGECDCTNNPGTQNGSIVIPAGKNGKPCTKEDLKQSCTECKSNYLIITPIPELPITAINTELKLNNFEKKGKILKITIDCQCFSDRLHNEAGICNVLFKILNEKDENLLSNYIVGGKISWGSGFINDASLHIESNYEKNGIVEVNENCKGVVVIDNPLQDKIWIKDIKVNIIYKQL